MGTDAAAIRARRHVVRRQPPDIGDPRLTFSVALGSGTASFASDDGGCDVTVTTAEPTTFDGTFSCTGLTDEDGTLVVNAQGTFSATG